MTCGLGFSGRRNVSNGQSHSEKRVVVFVGRFLADWWLVIIGGSCHKDHFYRDKKRFLSRQKYACRDKHIFVAINVCRDKYLLRQTSFCLQDKLTFIATNTCLSRQTFVATKVLSRQAYFCRDKRHVLLRQTRVCRDKNYTYGSSRQ